MKLVGTWVIKLCNIPKNNNGFEPIVNLNILIHAEVSPNKLKNMKNFTGQLLFYLF